MDSKNQCHMSEKKKISLNAIWVAVREIAHATDLYHWTEFNHHHVTPPTHTYSLLYLYFLTIQTFYNQDDVWFPQLILNKLLIPVCINQKCQTNLKKSAITIQTFAQEKAVQCGISINFKVLLIQEWKRLKNYSSIYRFSLLTLDSDADFYKGEKLQY